MPVVKTKVLKPKQLDIEAAMAMLVDFVQDEGETEQKLYQKTTRTWREKPDHELETEVTNTDITATNLTDNEIYYFLHEGTRVRYAVLSSDWKSKTVPRRLSSGSGQGRVVFVSKKHPQPGIEAREWTDVIIRDRKRPFKRNGERVMKAIAKKTNNRGQE